MVITNNKQLQVITNWLVTKTQISFNDFFLVLTPTYENNTIWLHKRGHHSLLLPSKTFICNLGRYVINLNHLNTLLGFWCLSIFLNVISINSSKIIIIFKFYYTFLCIYFGLNDFHNFWVEFFKKLVLTW